MVPAKGWTRPELQNDGFPVFSSKATSVLQQLISEHTTVLLTTSHKSTYSVEQWKDIFKNRGITIKQLQCLPANSNNLSRKGEIINWFNMNNTHESFIILDDDKSLNDLPVFLKINLIQTSPYIGLTEEHLEIAKTIISGQDLLSI